MAKAQATVEFLMTYGWAILALIIALGALAASGILSPSFLVSEECTFGPSVHCTSALYNDGDSTKLLLNITNGFPHAINISDVQFVASDGITASGSVATRLIASGGSTLYTGTLSSPLQANSVKRFSGNITYASCAPELGEGCSATTHTITGRLTAKVLQK